MRKSANKAFGKCEYVCNINRNAGTNTNCKFLLRYSYICTIQNNRFVALVHVLYKYVMPQQFFVANTLTTCTIICCITTVQEVTSINGKHPNDCKVS